METDDTTHIGEAERRKSPAGTNRAEAGRFLAVIGAGATFFTFQTFDDSEERKDKTLVRVLHGTLDQHWRSLEDLNERGAGIFVTVNETDGRGRKIENITRARAAFVDLDGAPLDPVLQWLMPHAVVETSPGRWHAYWLVADLPLGQFTAVQKALAARFSGDVAVADLPRVMRLPGFAHRKGAPHAVRIVSTHEVAPYVAADFATQQPSLDQATAVPSDLVQLVENIRTGTDLHKSIRDIAAKLVGHGLEDDAILKFIRGKMEGSQTEHDARWRSRYEYISRAVSTAREKFGKREDEGATLDDFQAYMPMHNYIFTPTREPWPATSVNARLKPVPILDADGNPELDGNGRPVKMSPSTWLDRHRPVEQMTWAPGMPLLIRDRLISEGGWIERHGMTCLNLYRPPTIEPGDAAEADLWREHVRKVYPDDADHIVRWLAHRVQKPQEKINHAILLGGMQGIGKDTILEPVKRAVGPWNFKEVSPQQILGRFNGFLKSVILRVSEVRDLGEVNRFQFYEHMKAYTASPPDVLRVDEKNLREHSVLNCTGVIFTTNKKDSLYLPADDRRTYVAWSNLAKEDFDTEYWSALWRWYDSGGDRHVAAYLAQIDIAAFDAKAPPPKTVVFWEIVETNRAPEDDELADALDAVGNPKAVTTAMILDAVLGRPDRANFFDWMADRRNRRAIPHRMESCGYVSVQNEGRKDGRWVIGGARQVIYARTELSVRDRHVAVKELVEQEERRGVRT